MIKPNGSDPANNANETSSTDSTPGELLERLQEILQRYERMLVAYSGGVDSTLLLKVALDTLGPTRVLAVLGESESLARSERSEAEQLAREMGAPLRVLRTDELQNENYASNPSNRCYFCKSELYEDVAKIAEAEGFSVIADGTNLDDAGDFRPGRQAAREKGVISPLLEAGFRKQDIRHLSRALGLPTWDKPEMPCLASRIPYGQRVDAEKLRQIDLAEQSIRAAGIRGARVRHHGNIARLELMPEAFTKAAQPEVRERIVEGIRAAGFEFVTLDLEPYRRGRLNESLPTHALLHSKKDFSAPQDQPGSKQT